MHLRKRQAHRIMAQCKYTNIFKKSYMTPEKFSTLLTKKSAELKTFLQTKLPRYVGKLAVDFFQDNFRRGGWQDGGLKRWQPHLQ